MDCERVIKSIAFFLVNRLLRAFRGLTDWLKWMYNHLMFKKINIIKERCLQFGMSVP